jgi:REP element-mobilizing transposase RayT
MAKLLIDVLFHYREQEKYLLHEFVVMPNHFHLLITPSPPATLQRAMQFIKGGFRRVKTQKTSTGFGLWRAIDEVSSNLAHPTRNLIYLCG